ncbi:MAG: UDP-2,3-diacylglucosamine diphosphatase [Gammaproteobacteria bacterium]|nr:UDP-2,3-diacylglucosamine diphosphatase [Gammaproteobacteria bacterium]MCY4340435.1 UDP-2,3-diacylglucosamine diphosphatase [Gammaproteobacteria bacterium]
MNVLFMSDLHLDADRPEATRAFHRFLKQRAAGAEALYVLGDLFEAWVGDDDDSALAQEVVEALARLTAGGTAVFFARGNRDFLAGDDFARRSGAVLLEDASVVAIGGERVLLMHGDSLCTDDHDYQQFRAMVRDPKWQAQFLALPLAARRALAAQARDASRLSTSGKPMEIMDVNASAVAEAMRFYGVRRLIHGHTHRPAVHEFELDGAPAVRTVLGDWFRRGWALECDSQGSRLTAFDL